MIEQRCFAASVFAADAHMLGVAHEKLRNMQREGRGGVR